MTFREAEEYLLGLELFGMKFGLDRMHRLMTALGLPQRRFAVDPRGGLQRQVVDGALHRGDPRARGPAHRHLHLAAPGLLPRADRGGGGAGVRERFAAAVERAATRPSWWSARWTTTSDPVRGADRPPPTTSWRAREVEVAVVEAGLGGRYDATNVIPSKLRCSPAWGSSTRAGWARRSPTSPRRSWTWCATTRRWWCVRPATPRRAEVAERVAAERHARLVEAGADARRDAAPSAPSSGATSPSPRRPPRSSSGARRTPRRWRRAAAETRDPGRLEVVGESPLTIHDGAHNPAGARALAEALPEVLGERRPRVGVLACSTTRTPPGCSARCCPPSTGWCSPAARTRARCRRPRCESLAAKLGGPPSETVAEPRARARARAGDRRAPAGRWWRPARST